MPRLLSRGPAVDCTPPWFPPENLKLAGQLPYLSGGMDVTASDWVPLTVSAFGYYFSAGTFWGYGQRFGFQLQGQQQYPFPGILWQAVLSDPMGNFFVADWYSHGAAWDWQTSLILPWIVTLAQPPWSALAAFTLFFPGRPYF